jgi:DnaK suppressor protein
MRKNIAAANRKKFLVDQQAALFEIKNRLMAEIDAETKAEREGNKDDGMDTYELASEERAREISFILSDRERIKSQAIDDSLARLADGSYGVCYSCGLEIAAERLRALPFTRLCRDCQQDQEREARSQWRFDEAGNPYRTVRLTDADEEST